MSKLTQKGQITIPKSIRQKLGIGPGDEIEFHITQDHKVVLTKTVSTSAFTKYIGYLSQQKSKDPDQIVSELRGDHT